MNAHKIVVVLLIGFFQVAPSSWAQGIKQRAELKVQDARFWSAAFSPDGKTLATGSTDSIVRLWELSSGKELRRLEAETGEYSFVLFSPDGRTLATGGNSIKLWSVETGKQILTLPGYGWSMCFSPDGKTLVVASRDETIKRWDVSTGKERAPLIGHRLWAQSVVFSPDGKTLASGSRYEQKGPSDLEGEVILWDAATAQKRQVILKESYGISAVSFSPDGKALAIAGNDVKLWDLTKNRMGESLKHRDWVTSVTYSADGKRLLSGCYDGTLILWDMVSLKKLAEIDCDKYKAYHYAFAKDGKTLAAAGDSVVIWETEK